MAALADLGREIGEIAERVGPSVVGIGNRWRGGSGVVIGENRILTNAHNLHGDEVTITFADGRNADATVVGVDADGDLAVLEASTEGATPLELGTETPGVGAPVVALGNPNGHGPRVTFGFVSGTGRSFRGPRGRRVAGAVEHTAPLMPGSVRRPGGRPGGQPARHQHEPARQRLLPGHRRRCGAARPGRRAGSRRVAEAAPAGHRPGTRRTSRNSCVGRWACRSGTGSWCARWRRTPPPPRPGSRRATCSSRSRARPITSADDLFEALAGDGALEITLVRGTEERTVTVAA